MSLSSQDFPDLTSAAAGGGRVSDVENTGGFQGLSQHGSNQGSQRPPSVFDGLHDDDGWLDTGLSETEAGKGVILVPKNSRGEFGSRDYLRYMAEATYALENKMGVASHMVSSRDGEVEDGDDNKHRYIQETVVANICKVNQVQQRCVEYDFMDILQIPEIIDPLESHPRRKYSTTKTSNLILHFDKIPFDRVKGWQSDINTYKTKDDRISSTWLQSFLFKSCTVTLQQSIATQYDGLPDAMKGGVTYFYLVLKNLFFLSRDTVSALKKFLQLFRDKGLRRYKGENVVAAQKEIDAVCTRLDEVGELPRETTLDVLEGFCLCSVPQFADTFKWLLQAARAEGMLDNDKDGDPLRSSNTLRSVLTITGKAVEEYHALCTASVWHPGRGQRANLAQQGVPTCWNCGETAHTVKDCPKPKDRAKIEAGKKKWQEARASSRGSGGKSGERKKWGSTPGGSSSLAAQIKSFQGVPHAYCTKKLPDGTICGWNSSHSTKYHAMSQRDGFDLAAISPQHPLVLARSTQGSSGESGATGSSGRTLDASTNNVTIRRDQAMAALSNLERNASSAETISVIDTLRTLFSIK